MWSEIVSHRLSLWLFWEDGDVWVELFMYSLHASEMCYLTLDEGVCHEMKSQVYQHLDLYGGLRDILDVELFKLY